MFGLFKKKKEEKAMTQDEEMLAKAKAEAEAKDEDTQSEQASEDESFAAQAKDDGDENSQTAEERIKESEGTEKADEERAEEEKEEVPKWAERMLSSLDRIVSYVEEQAKSKAPANAADAEAAETLEAAFGAGNGVFQGEAEHEQKKLSPDEIASIVHKAMK